MTYVVKTDDVYDEDILHFFCILSNFPCFVRKKHIALELKYVFNLQSSPLSLSQEYFPYFFHSICDGRQVS